MQYERFGLSSQAPIPSEPPLGSQTINSYSLFVNDNEIFQLGLLPQPRLCLYRQNSSSVEGGPN